MQKMQVHWIVENLTDNIEKLCKSIEDAGHKLTRLKNESKWEEDYLNKSTLEDEPTIYYGSLETLHTVKHTGYSSGVKLEPLYYANLPNFKCQYYYPRLKGYLLNRPYMLIPYGELNDFQGLIFRTFGQDNAVFIRPNSGNKRFTCQLFYKERFVKDVYNAGFYNLQPEELCLISSPVNIEKEYRLVIVDKKVIASSLYRENGKHVEVEGCSGSMVSYAEQVAYIYEPDKCFTMDIAVQKNGEFSVIELNSFSCAGYYACNTDKIVEAVSEQAIFDWKEVNE